MQVASSSDPNTASVPKQSDAPHSPDADRRADWPAGPADDTPESLESKVSSAHQDVHPSYAQLSTGFPPRLPGLLTNRDRSGSEELALQETKPSRASSRIPAHSALSRMLQESSSHGEDDQAAAWSMPPDVLQQGMLNIVATYGGRCTRCNMKNLAAVWQPFFAIVSGLWCYLGADA